MAVPTARDSCNAEKDRAAAAIAPGGVVPDIQVNEQEADEEQGCHVSHGEQEASSHERVGSVATDPDDDHLPDPGHLEAPFSVFTQKQKQFIVFMAACGGFFSAISSNIYFPALNTLAVDFHVSSTLINLTLTSYMIFQGLAPTFIGDLADVAGRRPAYTICFVVYVGANIGLALCQDYASLFVLRCLQSTGSSGTIALGTGVVADIATSSERGVWMGWVTAGPMIAPAIGPVIGGILAQFLGWRAIFWFLVILATVYLIPQVIFFPETSRSVVGNGSIPPQGLNMSLLNYLSKRRAAKLRPELTRTVSRESQRLQQRALAAKRKLRFPNPLHTLAILGEKDVALLLFYNSLVFCAFYDITASIPSLFAQIYHYNDLQIGLTFIPFGVGCFCAPVANGRLMDWNFRRLAKRVGMAIDRKRATELKDFPLEQARVQVTSPFAFLAASTMICYGWVLEVNAPLAAPLVLQFTMGFCFTGAFNSMSVLLVDLHPQSPATATAANNLVRCLMGAGATAAILPMIDAMGRGWAFTFLGLIVIVFTPILWVLQKWGPQWREARRVRVDKAKHLKLQKEAEAETELEERTITIRSASLEPVQFPGREMKGLQRTLSHLQPSNIHG